ncbi:sugar phosphorylase [Enterococcus thailandicus]|uniref:Sucrose phosphorylase n=1 Tax=Enterococcus thailandicus TaxID=417368 RepID=A0A1L8XKE3_ENTTH|nr:sugar phosphorylase [Enterococcus thailandicus]ASZ07462.1 alpha-amylase [Enterococcus thailandicus]MDA3965141.1 sugar phosphorylase [Enterococcus thailandicus]OJG93742.1 sucrose phosphorylase-like protein [Enterococcus thailandicus]GEK38118.1 sucrose phosphorylase [Enterococcus thailandicus]GMB99857.1 sucrose phosphorylase [Enterococcus thailandicus]
MITEKIAAHLEKIYTSKQDLDQANQLFTDLLEKYATKKFTENPAIDQSNAYLITYGDSFQNGNEKGLKVLREVVQTYLDDSITDVHLLPMFPFTSDDGFSVTDYLTINPALGDWDDIKKLAQKKRLMYDFVANHMSAKSEWFKKFLNNDIGFEQSFVEYQEEFDTTNVTRPRTSPLFHEYSTDKGEKKKVWTTFSDDQVDVNPKDPIMLARLSEVLLEYTFRGASSIRLDAIGFLWKDSGTTCMHLPKTHEIVKMWRTLLNHFSPNTQIITETNVPHKENISYLGDGHNEANQVYQFPLPPLVLFSFIQENTQKLAEWASTIHALSDEATFFNFLASHDGIGMRPVEGILDDTERETIVERVLNNQGKVSYKSNPDGSQTVYELNINYGDALRSSEDTDQLAAKKLIAAHNILLSFVGVPAIYYHSIFGSRGDLQGVEESGINRRINRQKIETKQLATELDIDSYRKTVYEGITRLLKERQNYEAFSPYGEQEVLHLDEQVFALKRTAKDGSEIISLTNVTGTEKIVEGLNGINVLTQTEVDNNFILAPYGIAWIKVGEQQ